VIHALVHPWSLGFMQRGLLELVLIGVAGGVLGCWIVFYELSYSAESLAHSLLPGLVLAALLGFPLILGGAAGVALAAAAVALAARVPGIDRDTSVAVVITSLFGLGVLLALAPASPPGIGGLLFGDLLGVSSSDLITAGALAGPVLLALALLHRQFLVVGFDRGSARALGGKPLLADLALLGLIAAATLTAVQALGNLLVVAVLVAPAATARLLTRRLVRMMAVAAALAVCCGIAGLYLSFYVNTAAGASVAGSLVVAYLAAAAVKWVLPRSARPRPSAPASASRTARAERRLPPYHRLHADHQPGPEAR
jgi:ABC-type Mn2+/Zn2+ transport system permease subunit